MTPYELTVLILQLRQTVERLRNNPAVLRKLHDDIKTALLTANKD